MKKAFLAAIIVSVIVALTGCGGGGSSAPPIVTTHILSDPTFDGDIAFSSGIYTPSQAIDTQNVFVGIDPAALATEYRGFLDFPLGGVDGVPSNAIIVSASLTLFINDIRSTTSTIPIDIELVSFSTPLSSTGTEFNSAPLVPTTIVFPFLPTDINNFVSIDVTSLMAQAQSLRLPDFQIRLLLDLNAASGFININDITGPNRTALAPLLTVTYQ